ncbi:MAG: YceH family protein [Lentisphaerae bacterium]|nr:YceH family protein [Lentisphaerota bacterium]
MQYELNTVEARVLGCLIEKQFTTPDTYPLTLNSLTLACNQKSNRNPVMEVEEQIVLRTLDSLRDKKLIEMVNMAGSRVMKYRHQADRALELETQPLALLCELLLRGPQTAGELRGRVTRMCPFEGIDAVEQVLVMLAARTPEPLAVLLPRQPGHKESRYAHLLSGAVKAEDFTASAATGPAPEKARITIQAENERIEKLESELSNLRQDVTALQSQIAELKKLLG